jgi:uncharacterized protein YraI
MASTGEVGWVQVASVVISNIELLPVIDPASGLLLEPGAQPPAASAATTPAGGSDAAGQPLSTPEPPAQGGATAASAPDQITVRVIQIDTHLNVRSGPSTTFTIIGKAESGETFEATGRNAEATWVEIKAPEVSGGIGWVSGDFVTPSQPLSMLPVSTATAQITPTPVPVVAATVGDITCATNQIIKWDGAQGAWVCSDDLTALQAEVEALRSEVDKLRAEIEALKQ